MRFNEAKSFPITPPHSKTLRFNEAKSFPITPPHSKTLRFNEAKSFPIGVAKPRGEATPPHSKTLQFDAIEDDERRKKGSTSPLTGQFLPAIRQRPQRPLSTARGRQGPLEAATPHQMPFQGRQRQSSCQRPPTGNAAAPEHR